MTRWRRLRLVAPVKGRANASVSLGALPALPHCCPYGTIAISFISRSCIPGISLSCKHPEAATALGPPADDAAGQHEQPAEPDQGCQGIDKDANSGARRALPVGKEDIHIGQGKCRNGDLACWLILKVLIELAARVDVTQ